MPMVVSTTLDARSGRDATTAPIRVVVVDDHMVVRAGLKAVLQGASDITVVGEGASGLDALALVERLDPDVVIMDLSMEPVDGAEATKQLHANGARARVLVLTMHAADEVLVPLMRNGASGFLEKHAADRELIDAVRTVARGELYLQASAANALAAGVKRRSEVADELVRFEKLTGRERAVLRYVAEGFSAPEIGMKLHISPKTVDTYKQRIGEKVGLVHRSDYVRFALTLGILVK
jgi:two-component system response regulator NreC